MSTYSGMLVASDSGFGVRSRSIHCVSATARIARTRGGQFGRRGGDDTPTRRNRDPSRSVRTAARRGQLGTDPAHRRQYRHRRQPGPDIATGRRPPGAGGIVVVEIDPPQPLCYEMLRWETEQHLGIGSRGRAWGPTPSATSPTCRIPRDSNRRHSRPGDRRADSCNRAARSVATKRRRERVSRDTCAEAKHGHDNSHSSSEDAHDRALWVSGTVVARAGAPPSARHATAPTVAKPAARALADVGIRLGAAHRAAGGDPDRSAVLYRLRSAIRSGHPE